MRVVAFLCRVGLLGVLLCLAACGSSNTEGRLRGTWFGPSLDGRARRLDIDGDKKVLAYSVDGNPTGLSGFIKHIDGLYYEIKWFEDEEEIGKAVFLLGTTGEHAAFYDPDGSLAALQRGADTWNPDGYTIEDVTPVYCAGDTWFLDDDGADLGDARSNMDVFEDASYVGEDSNGRLFGSPVGEVLAVVDDVRGIYRSAYQDQFRDADAELSLLMTPDKLFVVAFANWTPFAFADGWTATWMLEDVVLEDAVAPAAP
jgi:hypothetical protein